MNPILKKLKDIQAEACVTIILNTHRTRPDNEKDPLLLKNLLKNAQDRLYATYEKRFVWPIIENLNAIIEKIDHQHNLESLLIFANQEIAEYTRLPIPVQDRVVIDNTFATRDLVRAMHQEASYYVLVLSRQNARLIEALNDKVVQEIKGKFPISNSLYTTSKQDLSSNKGTDILIEEFFNSVDKIIQEVTKDNPLPLMLATESRNFDYYKKVADKKHNIIGHINKNRDDDKAQQIVEDAWETVLAITKEKNTARLSELRTAVSSGKFLSDLNEIWLALNEGRGQTLFVKKGYFQPAILSNNVITPMESITPGSAAVIDDIVDEMIEINLAYGGDSVFVEGNELDKFNNLALVTRY